MERKLVPGGFYRHFKNKLYQVKCVAFHSETKEKMVVYQAMYGEYDVYVRPYDMFMSEVDHVKYPEVAQKYRFEQVDPVTMNNIDNGMPEEDSPLEKFLDARGYEDKLDVLMRNKDKFTDEMIDIMAESLEVVVPEEDTSKKLESLKKVLQAHTKYEGSHLRP